MFIHFERYILRLGWLDLFRFALWICWNKIASTQDIKTVSQCYSANGFSFVSMYCGFNKAIHIEQVTHGSHPNTRLSNHCARLHGDCVIDSYDRYEWSTCEGRHSCVHHIRYVDMGQCPYMEGEGGGAKGESHVSYEFGYDVGSEAKDVEEKEPLEARVQYLEIKYSCRPVEDQKVSVRPQAKENNKDAKPDIITHEICRNYTGQTTSLILQNPGYPDHYIANMDCRCVVQAPENTRVTVDFKDVSLLKREEYCIDWLLLKSPGNTESTIVACGNLGGKERTIESKSNWLLMHFHTSKDNFVDRAKYNGRYAGFQIQIHSESRFRMKCYKVDPTYIENLTSEEDALSTLVLPASNWNSISAISAQKRSSANIQQNRMTLVFIISTLSILIRR